MEIFFAEKGVICRYDQRGDDFDLSNTLRPETPFYIVTYTSIDDYEEYVEIFIINGYRHLEWPEEVIEKSFHEWKGYGVISELYPAGTD